MRVGYFGDGPWAHQALYKIIEQGHEVLFVVPRYDTQDPALKRIAERYEIPWTVVKNVNSVGFIENVQASSCDIMISMSFNQIIRKNLRSAAPMGFINCHAGALPFYRGRNPINWALINGEDRIGVTVHFVDEGIDTGDIITQYFIDVLESDDYASLLEKGYVTCAEALCKALSIVSQRNFRPTAQDEIDPVGFYCCRRVDGDEYIDWSDTSENIRNFIRAITKPGPGAISVSSKYKLIIYQSRLVPDAPDYKGVPGEVVGVTEDSWVVKTGSSVLQVLKEHVVCYHDQSKKVSLRIGDRIGLTFGNLVQAVFGNTF
jgi:methionyl-tRNA formyltransferase